MRAQHPLVRRRGARAVTRSPGHRRQRLLRVVARATTARRRPRRARARPQRRRRPTADGSSSCTATSATRAAVATAVRRHRRRLPQRRPGAAGAGRRAVPHRQRRRHGRPARRVRGRRRRQGRAHVVERGVRGAGVEPGPADDGAVAGRGVRPRQAGRRVGLPRRGGAWPRRDHRPSAHDPRSRPSRHLRHPVRLDRRRRRRVRARRRVEPLPVRPCRRPRRVLPPRRRPRRAGDRQRRHRSLRHDARVAARAVRPRRHRIAGALAAGRSGGRWRCTPRPRCGSPRSPRTTG